MGRVTPAPPFWRIHMQQERKIIMKKKSVSLLLALTLVFSLFPAAAAAESGAVTPTPPEWIKAEEYLVIPDDAVYAPVNWTEVEALREDARQGGLLPEEGKDWAEGSAGACYETGLVRLKYAENAGVETQAGRKAFYSAGRAFSAAESQWYSRWKEHDELYYRLDIEKYRAWLVFSYAYVNDWGKSLAPALEALNMSADDFFDGQYMYLVSEENRAKVIADIESYRAQKPNQDGGITLWIDGKQLRMDTAPEVRNERTMVPIRAVAEALGAKVEWMQETQQILMTRAGSSIIMTLDSTSAMVDEKVVEMDVAPYVSVARSRTLIPARYVAEFFGQKVEWDGEGRRVLITEDKSVAGKANLEAWALPMGAMLAKLNAGNPTWFGLYPRDASVVEKCQGTLTSGTWDIPDRDDLAYTVLAMTIYGHDSTFREMAEDVKLRTEKERKEISEASSAWPSYMWEYTEYVDEKWGDRGIMAWDLFRMSNLVQWGYTAGYVTYEEALALLEPAAMLLCESFSSWDEAYENYLDGYNWWARNNVLNQDIWETQRGKIYLEMKADPAIGAIFDDTLFQTGVIGLPEE